MIGDFHALKGTITYYHRRWRQQHNDHTYSRFFLCLPTYHNVFMRTPPSPPICPPTCSALVTTLDLTRIFYTFRCSCSRGETERLRDFSLHPSIVEVWRHRVRSENVRDLNNGRKYISTRVEMASSLPYFTSQQVNNHFRKERHLYW